MAKLTEREILDIIDTKLDNLESELAAMARRAHGLSNINRDRIGHIVSGIRRMIEYN